MTDPGVFAAVGGGPVAAMDSAAYLDDVGMEKERVGFDPSGMLPTLKLVQARHGDSLKGGSAHLERDRLLMTRLGNGATIQMDVLRRQKDRSYKNVFKGSVLVGTLMDHDESKFATRLSAIKFAQKLLDAGHIESIVGSAVFEDSVHLYRWADETVVREAKKMVSTTSHIPRKKLIELVDMNQGDLNDDTYDMSDVKDKLIAKFQAERPAPLSFATKEERRASRKERAARRRTLGAMQIGEAMDQINDESAPTGRRRRTRATEEDLVSSNNSTNLSRSASQSQENLGTNGYASENDISALSTSPIRRRRRRSPSPPASPVKGVGEGEEGETQVSSKQSRRRRANAMLIENATQNKDSLETEPTINGDRELNSKNVLNNNISSSKPRTDDELEVPSSQPPPPPTTSPPPPIPCSEPICGDQQSKSGSDSNNNANDKTPTDEDQKQKVIQTDQSASLESTVAIKDPVKQAEDVSTCVYDGVEMKALDIEHVDFDLLRPKPSESLAAINRSLESLTEQSYSYSDNEKQLFEQMKRMQAEHEKVVKSYEDRITELLSNLAELRHLAGKIDNRNGLSTGGQHGDVNGRLDGSISSESDLASPTVSSNVGVLAPPPIPPPPLPPAGFPLFSKIVKPSKAPIKPRLKMRPLFWNRIILEKEGSKEKQEPTFWHVAKETKIDMDGFERLFGKADDEKTLRAKSLHDAMSSGKGKGRAQGQGGVLVPQTAKILEDNRSRAVAIKLRSMHCQMSDIKQAVYNMDFSKIELDNLYSLYLIQGTKAELDRISVHLQCHEDVALDQPEQFLWELSQMSHFPERIECMMLQKRFNETLFNIDQQLSTVEQAADEIRHNTALRTIMETILSIGNYMNGGTQRGQADGFEYAILAKIKDVKSIDNSINLLQYLVRTYMKDYEEDAGKDEAVFRLPDPAMMSQGATVSFAEVDLELNNLQHQLQSHSKKARLVCQDTEPNLLQPFKDKMDDFFETAEVMIKDQQEKLEEVKAQFQSLLRYLAVKDTTEQTTPEIMFSIWASFIESFKTYWKLEHKRIARMMFEKVEQKKRNRMRAARRRKSVVEDGKSNMKQRFAQLRRRSENVNPTVKMLRSQSMTDTANHAESDSDIGRKSSQGDDDGRRRRRRPQSDVYESEAVNYHSDASVTSSTRSETLSERMQRRRRSRINSEEVQHNIQNARQENNSPRPRQRSMEETGSGGKHPEMLSGRRFNSVTSLDSMGNGYSSDTDKLNQQWHQTPPDDSSVFAVNSTNNNSHDVANPRRRRRQGVVTRDDTDYQSDAAVQEQSAASRRRDRARYHGMKNSDSLASLTDATRYKPAGDRTPIVPAATSTTSLTATNGQHYPQNRAYKQPRSRYAQQQYGADPNVGYDGSDVTAQQRLRTASPCGSSISNHSADYPIDPGAPPRPALPASYNMRSQQGSSDNDIMDTDQEKINYREAIRKMSGGTRRRSTELVQKNPDINRRAQDMSPMGRLR